MSNERYESTLTQEEDLGKAWKRAFVKVLADIEKFSTLHERAPRIVGFPELHKAWIIKTDERGHKCRFVRDIAIKGNEIFIEKVDTSPSRNYSSVDFSCRLAKCEQISHHGLDRR